MYKELIPSRALNDAFIKNTDEDLVKVNDITLKYLRDRIESVPSASVEECTVDKVAHIVTLTIIGIKEGKPVKGTRSWTIAELLTTSRPVTHIFDDLLKDVFEAPLEGASVS